MKNPFTKRELLKEAIHQLEEEIVLLTDPTTERYKKTLDALQQLKDISRADEKTLVKDWGPVIVAGITASGSLIAISMITHYEEFSGITTKALGFIRRF